MLSENTECYTAGPISTNTGERSLIKAHELAPGIFKVSPASFAAVCSGSLVFRQWPSGCIRSCYGIDTNTVYFLNDPLQLLETQFSEIFDSLDDVVVVISDTSEIIPEAVSDAYPPFNTVTLGTKYAASILHLGDARN